VIDLVKKNSGFPNMTLMDMWMVCDDIFVQVRKLNSFKIFKIMEKSSTFLPVLAQPVSAQVGERQL
jgi:hypothetical protein